MHNYVPLLLNASGQERKFVCKSVVCLWTFIFGYEFERIV
jgi:hypothetical protein